MLGEAFHDYTRHQIYYFLLCRTLEGRRSFPSGSLWRWSFQCLEFLRYPIPLSSSIMVVMLLSFYFCLDSYAREKQLCCRGQFGAFVLERPSQHG
jgi:hypothetical protein